RSAPLVPRIEARALCRSVLAQVRQPLARLDSQPAPSAVPLGLLRTQSAKSLHPLSHPKKSCRRYHRTPRSPAKSPEFLPPSSRTACLRNALPSEIESADTLPPHSAASASPGAHHHRA